MLSERNQNVLKMKHYNAFREKTYGNNSTE